MRSLRRSWPPIFTSVVIASRYIPVWIANLLLIALALAIAPATLSSASFSALLPLTSFLAIVSLGQMLVIMTGGIDLSVPGVMTLDAILVVGVAGRADDRLGLAILVALVASGLIGLVNGLLIGVLKLNAVIVTLAVGQIIRGVAVANAARLSNGSPVPDLLSTWATDQFLGISWIFWAGIVVTFLLSLLLLYTEWGRRFQSVGANPLAAWIVGIRVNGYIAFAYIGAGLLYGLGGILLAGFLRTTSLSLGDPYLLAPIAAVVIGGASLTGGLASAISTWGAAFFLTLLSQMLRVLHLSSALQFVAFGIAIIGGMVISGDRIITIVEGLFRRISNPSAADGEQNDPSAGAQALGST